MHWLFLATTIFGQPWSVPPTAEQRERYPELVHETFVSKAMQQTVGYNVILPPSYSERARQRYPVVYWLHGGGGNESSSLSTAASWKKLYPEGKIQEVIIVYPNGHRSGYMDHADGRTMVESMLIRELIPRIDKRFRTIPRRDQRAVHGFSMGSSGALRFVLKYPDLFGTAVAYGGGAIDLEKSENPFVRRIVTKNLRDDPKRIQQHNTFYFLKKNHRTASERGLQVLLICGENDSWLQSAIDFQQRLAENKIPCELAKVPNVGHQLGPLMDAQGAQAARFQDERFVALAAKNK